MSDAMAAIPVARAAAQVSSRTRARYRAERRFRAYGLAAILLAAAFIVTVLVDVLLRGLPAFVEHRAALTLEAEAEALDPKGQRQRGDLLAGDYKGLLRRALHAQFPHMQSRADKRLLNELLSSGAEDDFRAAILADPARIGSKVAAAALFSADVDQYFKGKVSRVDRRTGAGAVNLAQSGEAYRLTTTGSDFMEALAAIREHAGRLLRGRERELRRLELALTGQSGEAAGDLQARAAALREEIGKLTAVRQAEEIVLADNLPSVLMFVQGGALRARSLSRDAATAEVLLAPESASVAGPGAWSLALIGEPAANRRLGDKEIAVLEIMRDRGMVERGFAWRLFTSGDSREPELAGLRGALIGSVLTLLVTLALSLPLGVAAAVYLEEFAPKNRLTELIEININNLAAVPSIVFGLLGLAIFLNAFGLPRSAPLVGGLVLALLVLPTIIIAARAALKAVPQSIKEAALAVGASHQQAIFHHVLPLAAPGIMTGTIIGMAHALGETAPLLMIGMVAFIVDVPSAITDAATVLPVQIYLWSDLPEAAFEAKTAATILVLLLFLFVMNAAAILVRRRFERRW
jgi:phosphate transport system permease protein